MERRDKQVDGRLYSIMLPAPTAGMPLCARAAVVVGPLMGLFADARSLLNEKMSDEERKGLVLEKFGSVLKSCDPVAINQLMLDAAFCARLSCDGELVANQATFDRHFASYRPDVFPILIWCLWECISDFFPELGTFAQAARVAAVRAFGSPKAGPATTGSDDRSGMASAPGEI